MVYDGAGVGRALCDVLYEEARVVGVLARTSAALTRIVEQLRTTLPVVF